MATKIKRKGPSGWKIKAWDAIPAKTKAKLVKQYRAHEIGLLGVAAEIGVATHHTAKRFLLASGLKKSEIKKKGQGGGRSSHKDYKAKTGAKKTKKK